MIKNPVHPGAVLREDVVTALGISAAEAARRLQVSARSLRRVLHESAPINADLAVRLEQAGIGQARCWIALQGDYDLAQALGQVPAGVHRLG